MIIVLGANGQVGRALIALLGPQALGLDRQQADLSNNNFLSMLDAAVAKQPITAIINAAAYTQVDKAEEERELAQRINAQAVGELAGWCKMRAIPLVHFSTDYVFDGSGNAPRNEDAPTAPLGWYGETKREGEALVEASGADYLIFRTSWIYDESGRNFANTMHRLFQEKETISVVDDQIGAPTYAPQLAEVVMQALATTQVMPVFPCGIYHLCHASETSWCGFARAILALASSYELGVKCTQISPIPTTAYKTPARRPLNSRLDCSKAHRVFSVQLPHWQEGLRSWAQNVYADRPLSHS